MSDQLMMDVMTAFRTGQHSRPILPSICVIEPTNHCNSRCIMCPNHLYDECGYMEMALFKRIIDQISPNARMILLYFVGEPLLHPDLMEMIRYCKKNATARLLLSTNALLLEGQLADALLTSGLDEIILCVEGETAETHESIRPGADFKVVQRNVTAFVRAAVERGGPHCIVQMISMHRNCHEADAFQSHWDSLGSMALVTWLSTWANQFPGLATLSDYLCPNRDRPRQPCAELWYKMVVNWKGEVVLCCLDWSGRYILGDLRKDSVESVWNSRVIESARSAHQSGSYSDVPLCAACFEWSSEEEALEFLVEPEQWVSWRV